MKPVVPAPLLNRRRFLRFVAVTAALGLSGCRRGGAVPTLRSMPEVLPALWRRDLPAPWRFTALSGATPLKSPWPPPTDLLALNDGWLSVISPDRLQAIAADALLARMGSSGERFLNEMPSVWRSLLLPVAFSPWVMVFRREGKNAPAPDAGWDALLDPAVKGKLLLPSSPRLLCSIAQRMGDGDSLRRLRQAAISFDDRFGMNWLLQGDARVAVLPLQRCMASLQRDPRLIAVLPEQGSPLHWTLLVRPSQTAEPIPQDWVLKAWKQPLLSRLLAQGWIPPLPRDELISAETRIPHRLRSLVVPQESLWQRSWALPPPDPAEVQRLQKLWEASAP